MQRPYSQHWLSRQDMISAPIPRLGETTYTYRDQHVVYDRFVRWGVVVTEGGTQLVQPFSFSTTKLLAKANPAVLQYSRRNSAFIDAAMRLPLTIGDIACFRDDDPAPDATAAVDSMRRISEVDVVYSAPEGGHPKRHRLALPNQLPQTT